MYSIFAFTCVLASSAGPSTDTQAELLEKAFAAMDEGRMGVLESILEQQPELVHASHRGKATLLHHAMYKMSLPAVKVLIAHGANVNAIEPAALTPLHGAARIPVKPSEREPENMLKIAKVLISHGADLDAQFKYDRGDLWRIPDRRPWSPTPLDIAALAGYVDFVELLLKHGAKLHAPHGEVSPLHWACSGLYDENHSKKTESPGNRNMIAFLVKQGADINGYDHLGETPLIKAIRAGAVDTVRYLVEDRTDVEINRQSKSEKKTALIYAVSSPAPRRIESSRPTPRIREFGMRSDKPWDQVQLEMAQILLANGADPRLQTADGQDAVDAAETKSMRQLLTEQFDQGQ